MGRVILVTGVSQDLGARAAVSLAADPEIDKIVGVDVTPPRADLDRVKFVRADIRNPVIGKVLAVEDVDTVVHLSVRPGQGRAGGASTKETNVIGTMQLLAACQRAATVRKLVLKSSTSVYGASPRDPAMFAEGMPAKRPPHSGFAKDSFEVEGYVRGLARRRPDMLVCVLRMANLLSPTLDSPMGRLFRLPVVPTVMGFDPRMQFIDEADVLAVLHRATVHDVAGVFNVAGDGVVMLSQAIRRMGKPALPVPSFGFGAVLTSLGRGLHVDASADTVGFLTHGRGVDTSALKTIFGYRPMLTSTATLNRFIGALPPGPIAAARVRRVEDRVGSLVSAVAGGRGDG
ncbi:MAG: NAD-dependent epimerase/dehydratase family protein [Nocardioidaceae bacterium]